MIDVFSLGLFASLFHFLFTFVDADIPRSSVSEILYILTHTRTDNQWVNVDSSMKCWCQYRRENAESSVLKRINERLRAIDVTKRSETLRGAVKTGLLRNIALRQYLREWQMMGRDVSSASNYWGWAWVCLGKIPYQSKWARARTI